MKNVYKDSPEEGMMLHTTLPQMLTCSFCGQLKGTSVLIILQQGKATCRVDMYDRHRTQLICTPYTYHNDIHFVKSELTYDRRTENNLILNIIQDKDTFS